LVVGVGDRGIVRVLLITGRAGFLAGIFGALNAVAGVAVNAENTRWRTAAVDVDVAGWCETEGILAAISADRSRWFDERLANRFLHLVFMGDDLTDGG